LKIFPKQYLRLQGQFFLYFAGLVLLVVVFVSVAIFYFQKNLLLQQAQEKAFSLTRSLAYTSLNAVLSDEYIILQSLIDSMMDGPDIVMIAIMDTNGRILASSTPEQRGKILSDPVTLQALNSEVMIIQKDKIDESLEIWDTAVPIFNLNKRIGTARMKYSLEDPTRGLLLSILFIGIAAVILSMILAYRFSHSISRPIRQAVELATEYGKGNLDKSLDISRDDEIGELVDALNKLSKELKTLIDEKIANENLVMMGEFASYIIHDLKNPLSGIHLLSDGLHRKIPTDSPLKKYATEILLASQKLHDFVERTLDISRWNRLNLQEVDIAQSIDSAIREIEHKNIPITREIDSELPVIQADPQMLLMVFKNLLVNAIEALDSRGNIYVTAAGKDGGILIIFKDDGCGISSENLKTIFRPFFSMKRQGHGLGLAMVRKAITLHKGHISVESKEGAGSTFSVWIPADLHKG
jgi:signal transduction histidine kinase